MKRTALKVGVPLVLLVVIAVAVILVLTASGGGRQTPSSADWPWKVRPVSEREIEALPPAIEPVQVTNRLGKPRRTEEAQLGAEVPQRRYFYYPVEGQRSQLWEIIFEEERLAGTGRCSARIVLRRGGGACTESPRR